MDQSVTQARSRLSERQRQCLDLVGEGYTSKEIARRLGLSPSTVDSHIGTALDRLKVPDRAAAVRAFRECDDEVSKPPSPVDRTPYVQSIFRLPPLGGAVNTMGLRRRVWHIIQIALLGIMGITTAVISIAGLVNVFSH